MEDKNRVKAFYAKAFDLEPLQEDDDGVTLRLDNAYLRLSVRGEEPGSDLALIAPALVGTADNGPRQVFGIVVENVDAVCRDLRAKGVPLLNGPANRSWGMRTASIQDPDGHVWAISQDLSDDGH